MSNQAMKPKPRSMRRKMPRHFFIQQAVDESIFSRIASATTAKQAWTILSTEYQGSSKVITVKLQSLRRELKTSAMKNNESVQDFLARVSTVVCHMKSYGEQVSDETVVAKVLRSLTPKFDHVVAAIKESKDLSKFSFDELMVNVEEEELEVAIEEEVEMTGDRTKFKGLDEAFKSQVQLGDNKKIQIEGQGKSKRAKRVLELIHADLCGSMRTESLAGSKYFMLLTDDFDRMSWAYFLKYKSESFDCFKKFKALVENQSGKSIKVLQTDHRGEFLSKEFYDFCDEHGILRQLTAPYTLEQNGVAERKNRTVVEMTQCMLKEKGERHKLAGKSHKHVFIGYCTQSKAYRLYERISKKINISRNVVFDEDACWNWDDQKASFESQGEEFITDVNQDIPSSINTSTSPSRFVSSSPTSSPTSPMVSSPVTNENNTVSKVTELVQLRRSERGRVHRLKNMSNL
ncbi:retrovirus-related pol polyprotein from transposon TNT 1-94 [Tanacetum coccineum]